MKSLGTLNVGIVGLGRLGKEYAKILALKLKTVNLLAACSIIQEELDFARDVLHVPNVYLDYQEMLNHRDLDLIIIVSSTNQHASQMVDALEAGYHVFCEKPLAINLQDCLRVEKVASENPGQLAMVGFVRRHDPAYVYAMEKIQDGTIGKPFLVMSQTVDLDTTSEFQVGYVKSSGGIFHDFNVHDIDLARWFLGSEIKSVYAVGGSYKHQVFEKMNDADNVMSTCVFENGSIANLMASRTATIGHDSHTTVKGTEGMLSIGRPNVIANVEIFDKYGARKESVKTFYHRFEEAFFLQIEDLVDRIIHHKKPKICLRDATQATRVAIAMTRSLFERQGVVELDQSSDLALAMNR